MKIKRKKKKSELLGFVILLKKGSKKEHTTTLYKKCNRVIMKCFSDNTINYINITMYALSSNIERARAKGIIYFEVYVASPALRRQ